jgi:hypothetical protein
MDWLISRYTVVARTLAWIGILAIIVLSVVPANDRPVSGVGQGLEHFTAFALVGGAFAIGYRFSLIRGGSPFPDTQPPGSKRAYKLRQQPVETPGSVDCQALP